MVHIVIFLLDGLSWVQILVDAKDSSLLWGRVVWFIQ